MKNKATQTVIPPLRFPEFRDTGGWEEASIETILGNQSSQIALNKLEFTQVGYPVYGADGVVGLISSYTQSKNYISIVKDGSGVGRLALRQKESTVLGTLSCLTSKNESKYKLNWLFYLMQTINLSNYIKGAGIPHIYYSDYKKHIICVPQFTEQEQIADCLISLDELIAATGEKIEALKLHKKGLMQQLFPAEGATTPALRFPEFQNVHEWQQNKLGHVGPPLMCKRIFKEQTISSKEGHIPFYKIGTFGGEADSYITKDLFHEYKGKYSYPNKGAILISAAGTIGRLVVYNGDPAYFQDSNIVWINNMEEKILNVFLYYSYQTLRWQTSDGGIVSRLYNHDLKNMDICYPKSKREQQNIAECLSSADKCIFAETDQLEQLKVHKKGLMQQLFPQVDSI